MRRLLLLLTTFLSFFLSSQELFILIHGLGRDSSSMSFIANNLESLGHSCLHVNYHSQSQNFESSLSELREKLLTITQQHPDKKINFVGHSLGGLLAYRLFLETPLSQRGICVSLGSPYLGTPVASWLSDFYIMRLIQGPVLLELGKPIINAPTHRIEHLCCLAGSKHRFLNLLGEDSLPHDGLVPVESALPWYCTKTAVIERSHNGLLFDDQTIIFINDSLISENISEHDVKPY